MKRPYWAACFLTNTCALLSLPTQSQVVHGSATISATANSQQISAADKTVIHWQDFSIEKGESVSFFLPNSQAAVLNRVTGIHPSQIWGSLESNGAVYLINASGIYIHKDAKIDVAAFIASTFDGFEKVFLDSKTPLTQGGGEISIEGVVIAREGDIVLVSDSIKQIGTIQALNGRAALKGIKRYFMGEDGHTEASSISVSAEAITLEENASIRSSGGEILIGVDDNRAPTAASVTLEKGTLLDASSPSHGGSIIVNSLGTTRAYGHLAARGGLLGGDGGFIEVSGMHLDFQGTVDATAEQGATGNLLLDPLSIQITNLAVDSNVTGASPFQPTASPSVLSQATINAALVGANVTIQSLGGAGPDPGNIFITDDITITSGAVRTLTLQSFNDIEINAGLRYTTAGNIMMSAPNGNILIGNAPTIPAQSTNAVVSLINGSLVLSAGNDLVVEANSAIGAYAYAEALIGSVSATATRDVVLTGGTTANSFAQIGSPLATVGGDCDIQIQAGRNLLLTAGGAGANTNSYAQIGHGTSALPIVGGTLLGDITATIGGNTTLIGGGANQCYAAVGHRGGTSASTLNQTGDISCTMIGNLQITGGAGGVGSDAIIGHSASGFNNSQINGSVIVDITGNFNLQGGAIVSNGQIGHFGKIDLGAVGTLTINANTVHVTSRGAAGDNMAAPGSGNAAAYIGIHADGAAGTPVVTSCNDIRVITAGNLIMNHSADSIVVIGSIGESQDTVFSNIDVQIGGDLTLLWSGADKAMGILNYAGLLSSFVSSPPGSLSLTANNLTISSNGGLGCLIGSSGPMTLNVANDITLNSSAAPLSFAWVISNGGMNINAGQDIVVNGANAFAFPLTGFECSQGAATLIAGRDILLQSTSAAQFTAGIRQTSASSLDVIAGRNMVISEGCVIFGAAETNLVVDNAFPSAPGIGPGSFQLLVGGVIDYSPAEGLRIFTALQGQNILAGTILAAGSPAAPLVFGAPFSDIPPERWCVYYPSAFFYPGEPYTIFYKPCLQGAVTIGNLVVSEALVDLNNESMYLEWPDETRDYWNFAILYNKMKGRSSIKHSDTEYYWMQRPHIRLIHEPYTKRKKSNK